MSVVLNVGILKFESADVNTVMERCLAGTGLTFEIVDNVVIVKKMELQAQTVERAVVKGYVKNNKGELLPGVTIAIKGTTLGTVSDADGHFKLEVPKRKDIILVFTFVGMKKKEIPFKNEKELQVVMEDESMKMDEVVVTGYANIDKKSFTGASVTIDREELLKVSKSNVLMAIQSFDPSFRIQKNNEWGLTPIQCRRFISVDAPVWEFASWIKTVCQNHSWKTILTCRLLFWMVLRCR